MKITSIALAALPLAAAADAEKLAGGLPVDCVAFQDADSSLESTASTLGMGRCLKSGDAICSSTGSSTGSWAFGIDRTDGTVKLWEDDRVLFASSEWADANVLCIGGNAAEYGPHEYNWYDEAAPYLFVSYDAGRSKAFLDCSSGGLTSAGDEAHLEINHIAESNIRMSGAPIVAFQDGAGTASLWSIDAWGAAQTNSGCEWRTDAVGFTAELAAGEDFGSQMDELVGLKQEEDEDAEDGTRTKNYILRAGMRGRWGGDDKDNDKDGDDKPHYDRTRWGEVLQARAAAPTCSPNVKSSKAPSAGKGSNKGRNLSGKSTKSPSAGTSSPTKAPSVSSSSKSSKSSKCSDKSSKSPKSTKAPSAGTPVTATAAPSKSPSKSAKSTKSPSKSATILPTGR